MPWQFLAKDENHQFKARALNLTTNISQIGMSLQNIEIPSPPPVNTDLHPALLSLFLSFQLVTAASADAPQVQAQLPYLFPDEDE